MSLSRARPNPATSAKRRRHRCRCGEAICRHRTIDVHNLVRGGPGDVTPHEADGRHEQLRTFIGPLRMSELSAWADMLAAVEGTDRIGRHAEVADLTEGLRRLDLDLEKDTLTAVGPDGGVAAVSVLMHQPSSADLPGGAVYLDGSVHPAWRRRGLGTLLVQHALDRATGRGAALRMRVHPEVPGETALAEAFGMAAVRRWTDMTRDLARPVRPAAAPDGAVVHVLGPRFAAERWNEPLRAAHNDSFAGHWGSSALDDVSWQRGWTGSPAFLPEYSYAATDGRSTDVVAYVIAFEQSSDDDSSRCLRVLTVGTRPRWRGRGLAATLLSRTLMSAADAGYLTATLTVDSSNTTGALGVYERSGFTASRQVVTYQIANES